MRRSRLTPLTGLFFNTGDRFLKTVDQSFDYSRDYLDKVTQPMLENERLEHKHVEALPSHQQQPQIHGNIQTCL
ncbi:hypothetical protein H7F15_10435 [Pontibacter sp. Tf4]|uniref:hypothetical protein n=1 Tax=Pontibacter sp. Tf4 TaxID=2761620 RepID=UPI001626A0DB|nr:hypothetical protein [Pontibacter sp. Tf4]MBB6611453.1 hypothetical protein [Pontibacter sp. Tf4]